MEVSWWFAPSWRPLSWRSPSLPPLLETFFVLSLLSHLLALLSQGKISSSGLFQSVHSWSEMFQREICSFGCSWEIKSRYFVLPMFQARLRHGPRMLGTAWRLLTFFALWRAEASPKRAAFNPAGRNGFESFAWRILGFIYLTSRICQDHAGSAV